MKKNICIDLLKTPISELEKNVDCKLLEMVIKFRSENRRRRRMEIIYNIFMIQEINIIIN